MAGSGSAARVVGSCSPGSVGLRVLGHAVGDLDGDGYAEQVSVRADPHRPLRCRYRLVVQQGSRLRTLILPVWEAEGAEPYLVGLGGIARGPGLEAIVDSGCCGAYVTGQWLFRETSAGLEQMRVPQSDTLVPDTYPNGASICCGETPLCGPQRGVVLIFPEGHAAQVAKFHDVFVYVQHRDRFVWMGHEKVRSPKTDDFGNCRPWLPTHY